MVANNISSTDISKTPDSEFNNVDPSGSSTKLLIENKAPGPDGYTIEFFFAFLVVLQGYIK